MRGAGDRLQDFRNQSYATMRSRVSFRKYSMSISLDRAVVSMNEDEQQ